MNKKIINIPNAITLLRLLLVYPICYYIYNQNLSYSAVFFLMGGILDGLDGFVARRLNQSSETGDTLDVIVDMITVAAVGFSLYAKEYLGLAVLSLIFIPKLISPLFNYISGNLSSVKTPLRKIPTILVYLFILAVLLIPGNKPMIHFFSVLVPLSFASLWVYYFTRKEH